MLLALGEGGQPWPSLSCLGKAGQQESISCLVWERRWLSDPRTHQQCQPAFSLASGKDPSRGAAQGMEALGEGAGFSSQLRELSRFVDVVYVKASD